MKTIFAEINQFRGSHYDYGYMQGEQLKDSYILKNRERQWKVRRPLFQIDVEEAKQVYQKFAPQIWDEFRGLKDALGWSWQKVLFEFGGYRLKIQKSGCSIMIGKDYFVRNYDYHPKTYDGILNLYKPSDAGYATIGVSQRITGRCDGMNEKGLVLGYTFINRKRPGNGFVCNMIARIVLEQCADTKEAVELLKAIPHRGSFSYILYDGKQEPMVVEASPRGVECRKGYTCTNHFDLQLKENRHYLKDSIKRRDLMETNYSKGLNGEEAYHLLNDTDKGLFSDLYKNWAGTIHTSLYFPEQLEVWFALGGDQKPAVFDFSGWLEGIDTAIDRVEGEVNTEIPFLNFEKADWFSNK
ncbi:acyl-CoA--6-aminopenicillanic acid acyltransferase [Gracilibacillus oryzae]|uniref:Acyl-CoA--6-aminopenicillanic acid acyltransferase n=1 Tax=Gracilibacillus oryzae TaxID=1672701 RepID=A0A7C8GR27_9BACI|nr:C45 family peptidase [Gracilibacillus oryzae]KAB8127474.1 acyl-CoA--6-aminopenicillanic acid acyltransferase [Gracilibacillus oryzae]